MSSTRPRAESLPTALLGVLGLLVLGAVRLWWAIEEPRTGERVFLLTRAGPMWLLAAWRVTTVVGLARERSQ
jgi:hypothetical protein